MATDWRPPYNQDIDDMSLFCCSHVLRHTSFMSLLGASRPVISSKATMAISLTFSSPSTTTHDGLTVSLYTCIWATSGVISGS